MSGLRRFERLLGVGRPPGPDAAAISGLLLGLCGALLMAAAVTRQPQLEEEPIVPLPYLYVPLGILQGAIAVLLLIKAPFDLVKSPRQLRGPSAALRRFIDVSALGPPKRGVAEADFGWAVGVSVLSLYGTQAGRALFGPTFDWAIWITLPALVVAAILFRLVVARRKRYFQSLVAPGTPAGWYLDPLGYVRWWEGSEWTAWVAPGPSPSNPQSAPGPDDSSGVAIEDDDDEVGIEHLEIQTPARIRHTPH